MTWLLRRAVLVQYFASLALTAQYSWEGLACQRNPSPKQVAQDVVGRRQDSSVSGLSALLQDASTSAALLSAPYANLSVTITPSTCSGTQNISLIYVTTTTTETSIITAISLPRNRTLPTFIAPPPFCSSYDTAGIETIATMYQLTSSANAFTLHVPFLGIAFLRATVKTTVLVAPETTPAISFGHTGVLPGHRKTEAPPQGNSAEIVETKRPSSERVPNLLPAKEPSRGQGFNVPPEEEPAHGHSGSFPQRPGKSHFGSSPKVVIDGINVAAHASSVVIGSNTFLADNSATAVHIVHGHTFSILPSGHGVIIPGGMIVPAAPAVITPPPEVVRIGKQAFSVVQSNPSEIEVDGSTIHIPEFGSTLIVISGSTFTLNPSQIIGQGSTAVIPATLNEEPPNLSAETVDHITFDMGSSDVIIDGRTLLIGSGAPASTLFINGEIVMVGPNGVIFPSTTVAPLQAFATIKTVDGIALSMALNDVVIGGSTFYYSKPTAIVDGSITISIGFFGIALASTMIPPPSLTNTRLAATTALATAAFSRVPPSFSASPTSGASPIDICSPIRLMRFLFLWWIFGDL